MGAIKCCTVVVHTVLEQTAEHFPTEIQPAELGMGRLNHPARLKLCRFVVEPAFILHQIIQHVFTLTSLLHRSHSFPVYIKSGYRTIKSHSRSKAEKADHV